MWKVILFATFVVGVFCENPQLGAPIQQLIHENIEKMCTKYNAKDKTSQAEAGIYSFIDCLNKHQDKLPDQTILSELYAKDNKKFMIAVYKRACRKVPEFKTCSFTMLNDLAVCGGMNNTEDITKGKKILDELLEYLCGNAAEKFVKLVNDDAMQCLIQKNAALQMCLFNAIGDWSKRTLNDITKPSSAEIKESCATFENLSKCFHTTLVECPTKTASEFIDGIVELVRKVSLCK